MLGPDRTAQICRHPAFAAQLPGIASSSSNGPREKDETMDFVGL